MKEFTSSGDRFAEGGVTTTSAEKAEGEGGRPEGTRAGFEKGRGVNWETRSESESRGFYEADGLEMDRAREREERSHEKKKEG